MPSGLYARLCHEFLVCITPTTWIRNVSLCNGNFAIKVRSHRMWCVAVLHDIEWGLASCCVIFATTHMLLTLTYVYKTVQRAPPHYNAPHRNVSQRTATQWNATHLV